MKRPLNSFGHGPGREKPAPERIPDNTTDRKVEAGRGTARSPIRVGDRGDGRAGYKNRGKPTSGGTLPTAGGTVKRKSSGIS